MSDYNTDKFFAAKGAIDSQHSLLAELVHSLEHAREAASGEFDRAQRLLGDLAAAQKRIAGLEAEVARLRAAQASAPQPSRVRMEPQPEFLRSLPCGPIEERLERRFGGWLFFPKPPDARPSMFDRVQDPDGIWYWELAAQGGDAKP